MSDPAIDAARRLVPEEFGADGEPVSPRGVVAVWAAREALKPIRDLHQPSEWNNCINACCSGEECKHRSRYCGTCDDAEWPCATARLVYSSEELS